MAQPAPDLHEVIQQVKDRVEIESVVGRRVQLQRRGTRLFGLCPFHPEKTPSFSVSPDRGFFKCFGCGKGGDVLTFLQELEGLEFWEALRQLAEEAGVEVPRKMGGGAPANTPLREQAREALHTARKLYREALQTEPARAARDYLERRKVSAESIEAFSVGWAPAEPGWLAQRLRRAGLPDAALVEAGLAYVPEGGQGLRDRFWERIVFPVSDPSGRTVGFGGRLLPGSRADERGMGKYVNSPEGPLFPKRRLLYGLDRLAASMREQPDAPVILCEGYLDVILLAQAGLRTTLAALGTAMTDDHARRLRRADRTVALLLDPDAAGRRAAFRAARLLVTEGVDVRVVELPDGLDPADMVACGRLEDLHQRITAAQDILEWRLETWSRKPDFAVPTVRARAAQEFAEWASLTPNPVLAEVWTRTACDRLGLTEASFSRLVGSPAMRRSGSPGRTGIPVLSASAPPPTAPEILVQNERQIVSALLRDPSLYSRHRTELAAVRLDDGHAKKVLNWCHESRKNGLGFDLASSLEAFAGDPAVSWLDSLRAVEMEDPNAVLERALRALPQNREQVQRAARGALAEPPSDEDLARYQRRVDVSPSRENR